ncbi:PilZ domain protein [compost metagenome]
MIPRNPRANGRADERFFLIGHGSLRWGTEALDIQVLNRSRSGLYVLSPAAPPIGARVDVRLVAGGATITARCEVTRHDVWHRGLPYLLGLRLRLSAVPASSRERWERFNRELLGGLVYGEPAIDDQGTERAFRRVLVPLRARLRGAGGESEAALLNLSEYGAGALAPAAWRKGESCEVVAMLPDGGAPLILPAQVAWCGASPRDLPVGLGLRLVAFEGDARARWEETVQEDLIVLF